MSTPIALAALVALVQVPDFQLVHRASESEPIAFVHVTSNGGDLGLGVFSERRRLAVWQGGTITPGNPVVLTAGERFILSPDFEALAVVKLHFPCLEGTGISRIAEFTRVRFPFGLPGVPVTAPPFPPQPGPDPILEYPGSANVELSEQGRLVAFLDTGHHPDRPGTLRLLHRPESDSMAFVGSEDIPFEAMGRFQSSANGRRIAHAQGRAMRLFDFPGNQLEELPFRDRFFLDDDGRWLARTDDRQVEFSALDPEGHLTGVRSTFVGIGSALEVRFLAGRALVRERERVTLVDASTGQVLGSRQVPSGATGSVDILEPSPGRLLLCVGWRDVLMSPMRENGKSRPGEARVGAEVFDLATEQSLARVEFSIRRWTHRQPTVRLAGSPVRMVVTTADEVRISPPLP
jgi:hypothetical protein